MKKLTLAALAVMGIGHVGCGPSADDEVTTIELVDLFLAPGSEGASGATIVLPNGHPLDWIADDAATLAAEDELLGQINILRVSGGLPALATNGPLQRSARGHSRHMAPDCHDFFGHVAPEGLSLEDRLSACGIAGAALECIHDGSDPLAAWLASEGDALAVLAAEGAQAGVGRDGTRWTLIVR